MSAITCSLPRHTNAEALRQGEEEIRRIGRELRANGTLRFARPGVDL
jgi:hypothetical protein